MKKEFYTMSDNRNSVLISEVEFIDFSEILRGDIVSSWRTDKNGNEIYFKVCFIEPWGVHESAIFDISKTWVLTESNDKIVKRVKQHKQ